MDGAEENHSWNGGWEGDEGAPLEVVKLRKQQINNFCCLLFISNGTPMFRAGDEFMHTLAGNNNPYNQDNGAGWIDWGRLHANPDIFRFFKLMIAFRKTHPSLAGAGSGARMSVGMGWTAIPTFHTIPTASPLPCTADRNRTMTYTS